MTVNPVFQTMFPDIPAGFLIHLRIDFQCIHCRRLHRVLPDLLEKAGGQFRVRLCPVPLSSACNPYIPASGIDRFAGSCPLTRYALAVWYACPDAYAAYWDFLLGGGDERAAVDPADAEARARALLGSGFETALRDPPSAVRPTRRRAACPVSSMGRTGWSPKRTRRTSCWSSSACHCKDQSVNYRSTCVKTGSLPSSARTYTLMKWSGISMAGSLGRSFAVKRYSVPVGTARLATSVAAAWIIG